MFPARLFLILNFNSALPDTMLAWMDSVRK